MSVAAYLRSIHSEAAFGVAETTHYPAIKALLNAAGEELTPKVQALIHPSGSGVGIPDGELWTASLMPKPGQPGLDMFSANEKIADRGGLEVKGLTADLDTLALSDQVGRYLARYRQVLLTNLRAFAVVQLRDGEPVIIEDYELAATPQAFMALGDADAKAHERPLKEFLRRALRAQTAIDNAGELAFFLASHARDAKARLDLLDDLLELESLKGALEEALGIKFATDKGDAFFRAQLVETIFYGLFSAWVLWHEENRQRTDAFSYNQTADYLLIPVIDRLYNAASSRRILQQTGLNHALKNATDVLNRVQRVRFFEAFDSGLAVQYFYEPFLAAFDPELRKQMGVWYTPPEIVRGMVARCDRLLRDELGEPDGLASDNVLVLDPCCGTGAYLVEALRIAADRWAARGEPYADKLLKAATERMFGFELLTGPFVIAHLQVASLLHKHGAEIKVHQRAAIYLTNALTGWSKENHAKRQLDPLGLSAESDAAHEVKREKNILVVMGNPPYSGYAGISRMDEERELTERYRPERSRGQGLNDLYVRFFAMADRRIQNTGKGLVSFISNYSWLEGLSFVKMRETFLGNYDRIWIDNLHGDKYATGKLTPEGAPDPSVFSTDLNREGIQVGTAVATLVRHPTPSGEVAEVNYRDFWGVAKRAAFLRDEGEYRVLSPNAALGFPLRPRDVAAAYLEWPRLPEIIPTSFPGVKTSRDDLLVDIDRDRLEKRMRDYFDPRVTDAQIESTTPGTMVPGPGYDAIGIRRALQQRGYDSAGIRKYAYRPFDTRHLFWESQTKLLDRNRADYIAQVFEGNAWLVTQQKPRREWSQPQSTRLVACLDLLDRGASAFPLFLHHNHSDTQSSLLEETEPKSERTFNLSDLGWDTLRAHGLEDEPDTLFFHALAIMHAPAYAAENAGALRQDWPRIPLRPADAHPDPAAWLHEGARLGRRVAALLDIETDVPGIDVGDLDPELRPVALFRMLDGSQPHENGEDTALRKRWGYRGQGGVVMPGPDASFPDDFGTRTVPLNANAAWTGVPEAVWNYHLGGYQVLKKWLSYREEAVLGRALTLDEVRTFSSIARRIAALLALGESLDVHYRAATLPA